LLLEPYVMLNHSKDLLKFYNTNRFFHAKSYKRIVIKEHSLWLFVIIVVTALSITKPVSAEAKLTHQQKLEQAQALCLTSSFDLTSQLEVCQQQVTIVQALDANVAAKLSLKIVNLYMTQGQFELAEAGLNRLEALWSELNSNLKIMLSRRIGVLKYRQGHFAHSMNYFKKANDLANAQNDNEMIAKTLSDIGTAAMAIGLYETALRSYVDSLTLKEKLGNQRGIAITLNNIGRVYHKMSQFDRAEVYFRRALAIYSALKQQSNVAHTRENIALILRENGSIKEAIELLLQSYTYFKSAKNSVAMFRVELLLSKIFIEDSQWDEARQWISLAKRSDQIIADSSHRVHLLLNQTKVYIYEDNEQVALQTIDQAFSIAQEQDNLELQIEALKLRIELNRGAQKLTLVDRDHELLLDLNTKILEQKYHVNLAYLQAEFEYNQQQKELLKLEKIRTEQELAITQQKQKYTLIIGFIILLGVTFSMISYRRFLIRKNERVQLTKEVEWHQNQVHILGESNTTLQLLLDRVEQATLAINHKQQIVYANQAATDLIDKPISALLQSSFLDLLETTNSELEKALKDGDSYLADEQIILKTASGETVSVNLNVYSVELKEEFQLITFSASKDKNDLQKQLPQSFNMLSRLQELHQQLNQLPIEKLATDNNIEQLINELEQSCSSILAGESMHQSQDYFRTLLVEVMNQSVGLWEQTTKSNRIELAEKSGIWRISIDDGRLRTRSLDRYMNLSKIPKKPRWREVVRTAHFVLSECTQDSEVRRNLDIKLNQLSQLVRDRAIA
jgi:two-component system, sensor histidine kinase ChiS